MSFFDKLKKVLCTNVLPLSIHRNNKITPGMERVLDNAFPNVSRPLLSDLERNASLAINFGHPLLMDGLRPVAPNYVFVGMMNCR